MSNPSTSLPPGFRFHPTDEELILHYLKKKAASTPCPVSIIAEVDIYKFDPWDLPDKAAFGEKEWYFFSPRDRKYPNGARPNRAAGSGYWKATGTDKMITATTMMRGKKETIGVKKALVFYRGRPPKGLKTSWIMHEYRLTDALNAFKRPSKSKQSSMRLDDWVLCRIYKKSHPLPTMAATDKEQEDTFTNEISLPSITNQNSHQLHKSSSFSDLLVAADFSLLTRFLLENPSDSSASELSSIFPNTSFNQPTNNSSSSSSSYLFPKLPQQEMSMVAFENQLKRQRSAAPPLMMDEGVLHPSKKINSSCTFTNITNQLLDTPQYNLLNPNQSLFNQHILLNSHLEFQ